MTRRRRRAMLRRVLGIAALIGAIALGWWLDRSPAMVYTYATGWSLCGAPGGLWPQRAR